MSEPCVDGRGRAIVEDIRLALELYETQPERRRFYDLTWGWWEEVLKERVRTLVRAARQANG